MKRFNTQAGIRADLKRWKNFRSVVLTSMLSYHLILALFAGNVLAEDSVTKAEVI